MLNRRTILKSLVAASASGALVSHRAAAQTPAASPAGSAALTLVDVPGVVLALSPDGTMAAGRVDREILAVWDVATFETIAHSEPLPDLGLLDQTSLTWSPDGTALAWSLATFANPGPRGPGINQLPRIEVTASGKAGFFFAGPPWPVALD